MQLIEVVGVLALIVLTWELLRRPIGRLREDRPAAFQLLLGLALGVGASAVALVFTTDLFPDRLEPVGRTILLVAVAAETIVVVVRQMF